MSDDRTARLDWDAVARMFNILPASALLQMDSMPRHQSVSGEISWLRDEPPLTLLFISHRWETLAHPDPDGRQLEAIQKLLRLVMAAFEAMLVGRDERSLILPSLANEGALQAVEIARRTLGYGPFGDSMASVGGQRAKSELRKQWNPKDSDRFRAWLGARIGVWLDYSCMPQKPHSGDEAREFRQALTSLGDLLSSSTIVSLRFAGDEYAQRGWCASEFFLASSRSFARGLFVDIERLAAADEVDLLPAPPSTGPQSGVLVDAYRQDREDFDRACEEWKSIEVPLIDIGPPDAWSPYRWMCGNAAASMQQDPNPFRLVLNAVTEWETQLLRGWLMSATAGSIDLAAQARELLRRHGLDSADPEDLCYLGVLTAAHGWVAAFLPLFREALLRYSREPSDPAGWECRVELEPLSDSQRALFEKLKPDSAGAWHSRLTTGPGPGAQEKEIVRQLLESLQSAPPCFRFVDGELDE